LVVDGHSLSDTGTCTLQLKFDTFPLLQAGSHYTLTGAYGEPGVNSMHNVNHYGTQNLLTQLGALADSAFAKAGIMLRYNDMSLINGGPFDITNNWNTPHQTHREGVSVDVSNVDANGHTVRLKFLRNLVEKSAHGGVEIEASHYHVTIR
jgi:hypothetical protein